MTSGGMLQLSVSHTPFVAFAALRATRQDSLVANAQQGFEFAFDPDVDGFTRVRANKMKSLHRGLLMSAADADNLAR